MEHFIQFCLRHIDTIVSCIALLFSLVIFMIKKPASKSIDDTIKSYLLESVPQLIEIIEGTKGYTGEDKKKFVVGGALSIVKKYYGRQLTDKEALLWSDFIGNLIESILKCPQKKEI